MKLHTPYILHAECKLFREEAVQAQSAQKLLAEISPTILSPRLAQPLRQQKDRVQLSDVELHLRVILCIRLPLGHVPEVMGISIPSSSLNMRNSPDTPLLKGFPFFTPLIPRR